MNAPAELRITVTETATTFSGATSLHRFDSPSPRDIAAQVRKTFGPDPAGAGVHLVAAPELAAQVVAALAGYDVALTTVELEDAEAASELGGSDGFAPGGRGGWDAPPEAPGAGQVVLRRPSEGAGGGRDWALWIIGAVVAAAAAACAVAIAATSRSLLAPFEDAPEPAAQARAEGEAGHEETGGGAREDAGQDAGDEAVRDGGGGGEARASQSSQAPVTLERNGLRVELPAGFSLDDAGPPWRATGLDPDFRLEIAVDELYNLPPETLVDQLRRDVEADPATELVAVDGATLTYLERPGDGSEVLWKTWSRDNRQLFVGCHTRRAPTTVQQATCRMAMESAVYQPVS